MSSDVSEGNSLLRIFLMLFYYETIALSQCKVISSFLKRYLRKPRMRMKQIIVFLCSKCYFNLLFYYPRALFAEYIYCVLGLKVPTRPAPPPPKVDGTNGLVKKSTTFAAPPSKPQHERR